ncbi:MAG: hypothetical protein IT336_14030 [Thermomicrobiales bacterium]|nr:hypothetical protein [Thermomicrobiales bacterium]
MNRVPVARAEFDDTWHRLGWTVVGAKLRAARNRFALTRRRNPFLTTLHVGVAAPAILLVVGLFSVGFASAVSGIDDEGVTTTLLAAVIAVFALGSFVGTSTTALQALYLADDIPFLMTLPIPLRALFGGKFVEAIVGALPPAMLFVAGMIGYGWDRSHHTLYWLLSPILGLCVALLATACSVVVVSAVTHYIPPRRARIFLFAISLLLISLTMTAWRLLAPRPEAFGEVVNREEYEPLWRALAWTPVGWSAESMSAAASGQSSRALFIAAVVIAATVVAVAGSFEIFRRTFVRGLTRTSALQTNAPNASLTRWLGSIAERLPRELGAPVLKEWLVLFRDLRRLAGAIWPVGIVLVYSVLLSRGSQPDFGSDELSFWSRNGSLAMMPWGLSLGISVFSYGSEGRNVQLLRILPLSPGRIYLIKILASLAPVGAISLGTASLSLWARGESIVPSIQLLALLAWMTLGFVTIDTAAAALAPNFETDQIQRTITLPGRLFSIVMGGVFALATIAGVGRLVLMGSQPPASIANLLDDEQGAFSPLNWPFVAIAALVALASIVGSWRIAVRQTERLIQAGE